MKAAYKHLVKEAINQGLTVSVYDGEEWSLKRSTNYKEIIYEIESVEEAQIRFRKDNDIVGWALIIPYGVGPDETVADCTMQAWLTEVLDQYHEGVTQ